MPFSFSTLQNRFALGALMLLMSGCATMNDRGELSATNENSEANPATYVVEIRSQSGQSENVELTMQQASWLNEAAVQSGAAGKYRRLEGVIARQGADGRVARMESTWSEKKGEFTMDTDFAIHPGDHLIFTEAPASSVIARLFGQLF